MKFYEPVFVSKTESDGYRILPAGIVLSENSDVRNIVPSFEAGCFSVMADCLAPYPQAQEIQLSLDSQQAMSHEGLARNVLWARLPIKQ
jgi:hypothetical protein